MNTDHVAKESIMIGSSIGYLSMLVKREYFADEDSDTVIPLQGNLTNYGTWACEEDRDCNGMYISQVRLI